MTDQKKAKELCAMVFNQPTRNIKVMKRLPQGRSNALFVMKVNDKLVTARIPGKASERFIDYRLEESALKQAEASSLTPKTLYYDTLTGLKVSTYIPGETLNSSNIDSHIHKVADALHKLHHHTPKSTKSYDPFLYIKTLLMELKLSSETNTWVSEYMTKLKKAYTVPSKLTLIHGDLNPSNLLFDEHDKVWLLDFEYAKVYDPLYDMASFASVSMASAKSLLHHYLDKEPSTKEFAKLTYYRALQTFTWYVIARVKHDKNVGLNYTIDFKKIAEFFKDETMDLWQEYIKFIKG
ncbi:MAG: phosphotransferase [Candidatus Izemoplasma sp.]|nr:phosphotransferase [Candidatus Izemoplasma sp.]